MHEGNDLPRASTRLVAVWAMERLYLGGETGSFANQVLYRLATHVEGGCWVLAIEREKELTNDACACRRALQTSEENRVKGPVSALTPCLNHHEHQICL